MLKITDLSILCKWEKLSVCQILFPSLYKYRGCGLCFLALYAIHCFFSPCVQRCVISPAYLQVAALHMSIVVKSGCLSCEQLFIILHLTCVCSRYFVVFIVDHVIQTRSLSLSCSVYINVCSIRTTHMPTNV